MSTGCGTWMRRASGIVTTDTSSTRNSSDSWATDRLPASVASARGADGSTIRLPPNPPEQHKCDKDPVCRGSPDVPSATPRH
ncbi:hypothetical protein KNE206_29230 [Kitasatospora sp. NE20-6]